MSVYGIDLGTCYSCIAKCDDGGHVEVKRKAGSQFAEMPSVVSFKEDELIVGEVARHRLCAYPESTIANAKREMDADFCKKLVSVGSEQRKISPVEVSACILWNLVHFANESVKHTDREEPIFDAVISVPATFNDMQRKRTQIAAELAGINVLGLIQEPTAAAIAYKISEGETILVFDLGGGTLDVSIVKNENGKYVVLGQPAGDQHLGGNDWDKAIIDIAVSCSESKFDINNCTAKEYEQLRQKAEEVKKMLSETNSVDFEHQLLSNKPIEITRSVFEKKSAVLKKRAMDVVEQAIQNAGCPQIDRFVLVGGSSCMPMIKTSIEQKFSETYAKGRLTKEWIVVSDPSQAIAKGAAIYAGSLTGANKKIVSLEDRSAYSYGFVYYEHGTEKLLVGNQILASDPIEIFGKEFKLYTRKENQSSITIAIVENNRVESEYLYENDAKMIEQEFILPPNLPANTPINVTLNRNKNGVIEIIAQCMAKSLRFKTNEVVSDNIIDQITETIKKLQELNK